MKKVDDIMIRVGILTASDKGSQGLREDVSGQVIKEMVEKELSGRVERYMIIPDERVEIADELRRMADEYKLDLVLTTGGTGLSPRDFTPEATLDVIDREAPGFAEVMRAKSMEKTPKAMLSRARSGVRGQTLIINMPGSPKAVRECFEVIVPALPHGIEILRGIGGECGKV